MKVGVIGAGTMGSGIAQVAATADCKVVLYDLQQEVLDKSAAKLEKILSRLIEKERINAARKASILENISRSSDLKELEGCDLVIEAIVENPEIKKSVFKKVEALVSKEAIIASNTSSLSITDLAACLEHPHRFIGIHFFNPAPLMKLVEIVPALQTSQDVSDKAKSIIDNWGKLTVQVKDTPGFIVNKVARPFYSESLRIYEEGMADFATIDWAMKELAGFRMGPFELMDFIGNDVNYTVTETVWTAFYYDPRYKPAFTQKKLSEAGYHGRKKGRGYYDYAEGATKPAATKDTELGQVISYRVIIMLINEAADTLYMRIANKEDIETAMTKGVNYPKGLLRWADEIGIDNVVKSIDALYAEYHEDRYRCCPLLRKMSREGTTFFDHKV
jgi:3-hydroxybutyryl-CoA dehydrogenase